MFLTGHQRNVDNLYWGVVDIVVLGGVRKLLSRPHSICSFPIPPYHCYSLHPLSSLLFLRHSAKSHNPLTTILSCAPVSFTSPFLCSYHSISSLPSYILPLPHTPHHDLPILSTFLPNFPTLCSFLLMQHTYSLEVLHFQSPSLDHVLIDWPACRLILMLGSNSKFLILFPPLVLVSCCLPDHLVVSSDTFICFPT